MSNDSTEKEAGPSLVMSPVEPVAQEPSEAVSEEKEVDLESMLGSAPQIPMPQSGPFVRITKKYLEARKRRLKVKWNGFGEKAASLPYPETLDEETVNPEDEDIEEMNKLISLKYSKEKSSKVSKASEDRKPKTMKPNFVVHFACHGIRPIALSGRLRVLSEDNNELRITLRVVLVDAGKILGAFGNTTVSRKLYIQRTSIVDGYGRQHTATPTPNCGKKRRTKGNYEVTSVLVDTSKDNVDRLKDTMQLTIRASRT